MQKITAKVDIRGVLRHVGLVKVGLDDDRRPWRVEAPLEEFDGWLMSDDDLLDVRKVVTEAEAAYITEGV